VTWSWPRCPCSMPMWGAPGTTALGVTLWSGRPDAETIDVCIGALTASSLLYRRSPVRRIGEQAAYGLVPKGEVSV